MPIRIATFFTHLRPTIHRKNAIHKGLMALMLHRILLNTGAALLGLFFPIYLYGLYHQNLQAVFLYGLAYYLFAGILEPVGVKLMMHIGLKNSMRVGVLFYILFFFVLFLGESFLSPFFITVLSLCALILWHITYWVPYHTEFAKTANRRTFGSVLGGFSAIASLIGILIPSISGWLIENVGYWALFLSSITMTTLSLFPLHGLQTVKETYVYGFFQTFKELFSKRHRHFLLVFAAEGAEGAIGFFVWPLFLFTLLKENYVEAGMITTVVALLSMFLQLGIGRLVDKIQDHRRLSRIGMRLTAVGWFLKCLIDSVSQLIFYGTFHSFALILMRTPFEALMYTKAADSGHYIDEYTVLREMALSVGRVFAFLVLILLGSYFEFWMAFILAGIATCFFEWIARVAPSLKK